MIESLVAQYGRGAVITVRPYMPDSSGEVFRWFVEIDGVEKHDLDVQVSAVPDNPGMTVATLVRGEETLELLRWNSAQPPAAIVDTLGRILDRT